MVASGSAAPSRQTSSRSAAAAKVSEYVVTGSDNKISRRAGLAGTSFITLGSKDVIQPDVILRGDLHRSIQPTSGTTPRSSISAGSTSAEPAPPPTASTSSTSAAGSLKQSAQQSQALTSIIIGKCTVLGHGSILHPPFRINRGQGSYYPIKIGENVFIGPHCQISASSIGSHVHIGAGSILQAFCVLKDNTKVLPGTVVPPNTVMPPGVIIGGQPAQIVGDLPDGWGTQSSVIQGPGEVGLPPAMTGPAAVVTAVQQAQHKLSSGGHSQSQSQSHIQGHGHSQSVTIAQTITTTDTVTLGSLVPVSMVAAIADSQTAAPDSSVWVEGGDLRSLVRLVK